MDYETFGSRPRPGSALVRTELFRQGRGKHDDVAVAGQGEDAARKRGNLCTQRVPLLRGSGAARNKSAAGQAPESKNLARGILLFVLMFACLFEEIKAGARRAPALSAESGGGCVRRVQKLTLKKACP
jgi:hypothetical protein